MTSSPQLKDYINRRLLLKTAVIEFVSPFLCFCAAIVAVYARMCRENAP